MDRTIVIGNSFPLSLIRRHVEITPVSREEFGQNLSNARILSFWGHENTLRAIQDWCGIDLRPATARPVLTLSPENFPVLDGVTFRECWVLSPDYVENFRPAIGEEVPSCRIASWHILRLRWL